MAFADFGKNLQDMMDRHLTYTADDLIEVGQDIDELIKAEMSPDPEQLRIMSELARQMFEQCDFMQHLAYKLKDLIKDVRERNDIEDPNEEDDEAINCKLEKLKQHITDVIEILIEDTRPRPDDVIEKLNDAADSIDHFKVIE